jgi:hypothetical protein
MKDIIEMALKAGFLSRDNSSAMYAESDFDGEICMEEYAIGERLKRFAALVRADEREQCLHAAEVAAWLLNDPIAAVRARGETK